MLCASSQNAIESRSRFDLWYCLSILFKSFLLTSHAKDNQYFQRMTFSNENNNIGFKSCWCAINILLRRQYSSCEDSSRERRSKMRSYDFWGHIRYCQSGVLSLRGHTGLRLETDLILFRWAASCNILQICSLSSLWTVEHLFIRDLINANLYPNDLRRGYKILTVRFKRVRSQGVKPIATNATYVHNSSRALQWTHSAPRHWVKRTVRWHRPVDVWMHSESIDRFSERKKLSA